MNLLIKISKRVESANRFNRAPWYVYKDYKNYWVKELAVVLPRASHEDWPRLADRVAVTIISCRRKQIDYDNFVMGCKPILDFLVEWGYLVNDDPDHCDTIYLQRRSKEDSTTIIIQQGGRYEQQAERYRINVFGNP